MDKIFEGLDFVGLVLTPAPPDINVVCKLSRGIFHIDFLSTRTSTLVNIDMRGRGGQGKLMFVFSFDYFVHLQYFTIQHVILLTFRVSGNSSAPFHIFTFPRSLARHSLTPARPQDSLHILIAVAPYSSTC